MDVEVAIDQRIAKPVVSEIVPQDVALNDTFVPGTTLLVLLPGFSIPHSNVLCAIPQIDEACVAPVEVDAEGNRAVLG